MSPPRLLSLAFYGLAMGLIAPAVPAWLRSRVRRGKEDPGRWRERLGRPSVARPEGRLAWLHGVSVGESLSLLPLAERLRAVAPGLTVLITTGTMASAEVLAARRPEGVLHQYAPLDTPGATRAFLDHWRPEIGVLAESELWPNLILNARRRGVRLALVSARLSDGSLRGWRRAPGAAKAVLRAFDLVLARNGAAAEGLTSLGARVDGLADLKFGAPVLPGDAAALAAARAELGDRPLILAASTHPGEEEIILAAFTGIPRGRRPVLVIVPRHPVRGPDIINPARTQGLSVGLRSAGARLGEDDVHVADTLGELGLFYRLASLAVVGGSFGDPAVGGHNPLEPARLDCPFITGPNVSAWLVYAVLTASGATQCVSAQDLPGWFARAVAGDPALRILAERAAKVVALGDAEVASAMDRIVGMLPP